MKDHVKQVIVKKYATAFINVFSDSLVRSDLEHIEKLLDFLHKHERVNFFLALPALEFDAKKRGLDFLCDQFNVSSFVRKLMVLLLEHKRIFLLEPILASIVQLYKKRHGIETFVISSYPEISLSSQQAIQHFLAHETGHEIVYTYKVDSQLISGIRMQSDEHVWEHSIGQQLHAIRVARA